MAAWEMLFLPPWREVPLVEKYEESASVECRQFAISTIVVVCPGSLHLFSRSIVEIRDMLFLYLGTT